MEKKRGPNYFYSKLNKMEENKNQSVIFTFQE